MKGRTPDRRLKGAQERMEFIRCLYEITHPKPEMQSPPPLVVVEPTNKCNLDCVYCARGTMSRKKAHMDLDEYREIIAKVEGKARLVYLHQSGEPLLHPGLREMIVLAREAGLYTLLNSNAMLLDEDRTRILIGSGLDVVEFSVDAVHRDVYEDIRRGGDAPTVWRNVLRFVRLNREAGSPVITRIRMVETPRNEAVLAEDKRLIETLPFDEVRVSRYLNNKNWEETETYYEQEPDNPTLCVMPWKEPTISRGGIMRCAVDFHQVAPWGSIEGKTLEEAWNSPELVRLRTAMLSGDMDELRKVNDICWRCNARTKSGYSDGGGFLREMERYGLKFYDYYFEYLRLERTPQDAEELERKHVGFDAALDAFEAYAGYAVRPL